jgi:uncharacterized membrane protein
LKKPTQKRPPAQRSTEAGSVSGNGIEVKSEGEIGASRQAGQKNTLSGRVQKIEVQQQFSGPLPPPGHLSDYEAILPGAAERILRMAENAQNHSAYMDRCIVEAQIDDQKRGMRYGLVVLLLIIALATYFGIKEQIWMAGLLLSTAALGSIPVFVRGRTHSP